jgi:tetratricopeptide (TPR) repeat protein
LSWSGCRQRRSGVQPLRRFSDGLFVEGTQTKYAALAGAKLLKVEGMQVEVVLEKLKPLVPVENDQYYKAYGLHFLTIPEALHAQGITNQLKNSITYTFEKDGKVIEQTVPAMPSFRPPLGYGFVKPDSNWVNARNNGNTPQYLKNLDKIYYFEYLPQNKTLYIRHSQIQDDPAEPIPAFYKKVFEYIDKHDVEKLVLDVRLNGGGNNYKNKPIITGILEHPKINQPGKLFVIIGRRTFSACQNLVNELSNYTNALFIGEPTSENINFYGDNRRVLLPRSKTPVFLSFAWWQDKPQWENAPWLAPQLAIDMSFDEYKTNKDPALKACLEFSDKDVVLDPFNHLKELFIAGKMDEVETTAKKMVTDPKYRYMNFESQINKAGYDLLNEKDLKSAIYVFDLNTKLYPKSANSWDSLAEAYWHAKQKEKALELYQKAVQLDPEGNTGNHAREKISEINSQQ